MKKNMTRLVLFLFVALAYVSCDTVKQQQLYYPNRANEPALNHAGDAKVNLSYDYTGSSRSSTTTGATTIVNNHRYINSFSVEGAYSPVNHLGIIGSFRSMYNGNSAYYRLRQGELGAGYYLPFGRRRRGLFELYGGADLGNMNAHNYYDTVNNFRAAVTAHLNDIFLQPAVGYRSSNFSIMYGWKFLGRKFGNINFIENPYDTLSGSRYRFLQSFLNITYGLKNYQLNFQMLSSIGSHNNLPSIDGDVGSFLIGGNTSVSIGLTIFITKDMFDFKRR